MLLQGLDEGIIVSVVAGFALDALSSAPFGLSMVSLALTSGLAGVAEVNIFRSARFLPFIMVCLATPLYYAFYLGMMQLLGGASFHISIVWRVVLPATAINLILMPFVYRLVKLLCAHTRPAQVEWQ